jgi:hypothetical protein
MSSQHRRVGEGTITPTVDPVVATIPRRLPPGARVVVIMAARTPQSCWGTHLGRAGSVLVPIDNCGRVESLSAWPRRPPGVVP